MPYDPNRRSVADEDTPHINDGSLRNQQLTRTTVWMTDKTLETLKNIGEATSDTPTDIVNRAVQVYEYLMDTLGRGGEIYIRRTPDTELQRLVVEDGPPTTGWTGWPSLHHPEGGR